jgi:hypothetical protein
MQTRQIFAVLLLVSAPLAARQKTDVVIMANGDRVTGEIKGLSSGVLRVDLDYVDGTVSLQWLKVARVESKQLFIIHAQDGSLYTGTIVSAGDRSNALQIAEPGEESITIAQAKVVRLEETSDAFFRRWSGEISLGLVYSKGNNSTQNTFGSDVEYRRERWGTAAAYSSNLSSSSGAKTSTRNQLDLTGFRLMPWKNYYYGGIGSFMQSSVQAISLQTTLGGGLGRYFKNTNRARISVLGGLAWQGSRYDQSKASIAAQSSAGGLLAADLRVFIFKKTNLAIRTYVVPSFTDKGRMRFNANASYYLKLFRNLSWNLSSYGNWDTRPPANFPGADYGYSVGLTWTFGFR